MKIVIKTKPFASAMALATNIAPLRGVRVNLRNALIQGNAGGTVKISATDMEIGCVQTLTAESVESPESICLPCSLLSGLLKECSEETVTLETIGAKGTLTAGKDKYEVLGMDATDFPDVTAMGADEIAVSVAAKTIARMINLTTYAAAREQGRYSINGVFIGSVGKNLEMVATDGRRLAFAKGKGENLDSLKDGVIIPLKFTQEIARMCDGAGDGDNVLLAHKGRHLIARKGDTTLSTLLVEGIFPKYGQVIPKNADKEITVNREKLLSALRKAVVLTSEETKTVMLSFSMGVCLIEARSPDKGQARVTMDCEYAGEEITMGFNPGYLSDGLKAMQSDTVRIELKDKASPGVVREGTEFLYILMPVNPKE